MRRDHGSTSALTLRYEFKRLAREAIARDESGYASVRAAELHHRLFLASSDHDREKVMEEIKNLGR